MQTRLSRWYWTQSWWHYTTWLSSSEGRRDWWPKGTSRYKGYNWPGNIKNKKRIEWNKQSIGIVSPLRSLFFNYLSSGVSPMCKLGCRSIPWMIWSSVIIAWHIVNNLRHKLKFRSRIVDKDAFEHFYSSIRKNQEIRKLTLMRLIAKKLPAHHQFKDVYIILIRFLSNFCSIVVLIHYWCRDYCKITRNWQFSLGHWRSHRIAQPGVLLAYLLLYNYFLCQT